MTPGTLDLALGHCQPSETLYDRVTENESAASLWMELQGRPILANSRDHHPVDCGSSCAGGLDLVRAGLMMLEASSVFGGVLRHFRSINRRGC
jgi:hypothetical protein